MTLVPLKVPLKKLFETTTMAIAFIAMLTPASATTTTVYKSIGKFGEVKFSQFPPEGSKNEVEIIELRSNGRQLDAGELAGKTNPPAAQSNVLSQQQTIEQELKDNAQRCQSLRNNLTNLNSGGRIYELDANGGRKYLSNREIELKRENYQKLIDQYCTGQAI